MHYHDTLNYQSALQNLQHEMYSYEECVSVMHADVEKVMSNHKNHDLRMSGHNPKDDFPLRLSSHRAVRLPHMEKPEDKTGSTQHVHIYS